MFNNMLFAGDLSLFRDNEDILQRVIFTLSNIGKYYNLNISKIKITVMLYKGKDPINQKLFCKTHKLSRFQILIA